MKRILVCLAIFLMVRSAYCQGPELPQEEFEKMVKELSNWGRWGKHSI